MLSVASEPGYVLHRRPYRETSALLEVFSREHGRVGLVARGAQSRWKGILQPFRPLLLAWRQRGELGTLTGAEQVAAPPALAGEALYCGLYLNELLMRLTQRGDPHPEVFERYRAALAGLSAGGPRTQPHLRVFEKHLLSDLGFGLHLDCEAGSGDPVSAGRRYRYEPERGLVPVSGDGGVSGAALLALHSEDVGDEHLDELRRLMRRVIRYHLGDRPLATLSLFK